MGMFGPKPGYWYVRSESDPRWNNSGRGYGLVVTGGPPELSRWLDKCRAEFGKPPDDLRYGFEKD